MYVYTAGSMIENYCQQGSCKPYDSKRDSKIVVKNNSEKAKFSQ